MFFYLILQMALVALAMIMARMDRPEGLLFTGVLVFPLCTVMAVAEIRRERYILSPLAAYLIMSMLYMGVASLWVYACLVKGYNHSSIFRLGFISTASQMPYAQVNCLLGVASYYFGYKTVQRSRWARNRARAKVVRTKQDLPLTAVFWVFVIAAAWALTNLPRVAGVMNHLGLITGFISQIPMLGMFMIITSRAGFQGNQFMIYPAGFRLYVGLAAAFLFIVFEAASGGMRQPFLFLIILLLWGYMLQRENLTRSKFTLKRIRAWILPGILGLAGLALIVLVIIPFGKGIAQGNGFPTTAEIFSNITNIRTTFPARGIWQLPNRVAGTSLIGVGACIHLRDMDIMPEPKMINMVLIGLIPRLFWPDKPYVTQGAKFDALISGGRRNERQVKTAIGTTAIGELYWSYGYLGLVLGMTLIGALYAFTFLTFSPKFPVNPIRAFVTADLVLSSFRWLEADATAAYVSFAFLWVVFYPLSRLNLNWARSRFPSTLQPPRPPNLPLPMIPGPNGSAAGPLPLRYPR